jgi:6-phosphofructokinase
MSTFAIVVLVIVIGAVATFIAMKKGTIADANNNNIPDAIEEKVAEVKEVAKKVKAVAEKATKVAKTVVVEKKATKKPAAKKTK